MSWIQTFTGKEFDSLNPRVEDVDIFDIAHALSMKCRFAGHTKYFYSVAQHSVLVMDHIKESQLLFLLKESPNPDFLYKTTVRWALLHDAAEAYFADIPNPIKKEYEIFDTIENKILEAIALKFGLEWPISINVKSAVKKSDTALLATEARDLLPVIWRGWEEKYKPLALNQNISPWTSIYAEDMFLKAYEELFSG